MSPCFATSATLVLLGLSAAAAVAAAGAGESQQAPWVCVPTQEFGWQCGRGPDAPGQTPLPEPPPPEAPPAGYRPAAERTSLPGYLRQPGPRQGALESAPEAEQPAARAEAVEPREAAPPAAEGPRYGIQLTAGRAPDALDAFVDRHSLSGMSLYRRSWRDEGGTWYVLLTGDFDTAGQARRALEGLAPELREADAWVRRVDMLERPETPDDSKQERTP